jgi:hypothetical protein
LKEPTIKLVNIGKANLVDDKIVEDTFLWNENWS